MSMIRRDITEAGMLTLRRCKTCGDEKPTDSFELVPPRPPHRGYRRRQCRTCKAKQDEAYEARRGRDSRQTRALIAGLMGEIERLRAR